MRSSVRFRAPDPALPVGEERRPFGSRRGPDGNVAGAPVFDGNRLSVPIELTDEGILAKVVVARSERPLVEVQAIARHNKDRTTKANTKEVQRTIDVVLNDEFGSGYGNSAGIESDLCVRFNLVHPAVWPAISDRSFTNNSREVRGSIPEALFVTLPPQRREQRTISTEKLSPVYSEKQKAQSQT
jgi:hypothetical protein